MSRSEKLFERGQRVTPGGVNSPVRAMRSVGRDYPLFVQRGQGSQVWDADGDCYTDWIMSWGALPLGHADGEVVAAATEAVSRGSSFGAPTELEVELAELICDAVDSVEQVRFVSSGTEATMSAARLARAATGRNVVLTFSGCYHGHADLFLTQGGSGLATLSIPSSPGVPAAVTEQTLTARYNDLALERLVAEHSEHLAAIVVEPVAANMGVVHPAPGFLQQLRRLCDQTGALLIFDEVITGFRLAWGGAQEIYDVQPDLSCFGKVVGGGFPVGAFGGRRDIMEQLAPLGAVYQAGTLSGNPVAMAAGLTTLRALRERGAYERLEQLGSTLELALRDAIDHADADDQKFAVSRAGSLVTLFHGASELPRSLEQVQTCDFDSFSRTHARALEAGHLLPPSQYEAWFVSTAHSQEHIADVTEAVANNLRRSSGTAVGARGATQ